MTPISLKRKKTLDGEAIFRMYWQEMGSARSIKKVISRLPLNPNFGRPYTSMAIWFCLWRYAFENLQTTYEIYNEVSRDTGEYHTFEEWKDLVTDHAFTSAKKNTRRMERWQNRLMKENLTNA